MPTRFRAATAAVSVPRLNRWDRRRTADRPTRPTTGPRATRSAPPTGTDRRRGPRTAAPRNSPDPLRVVLDHRNVDGPGLHFGGRTRFVDLDDSWTHCRVRCGQRSERRPDEGPQHGEERRYGHRPARRIDQRGQLQRGIVQHLPDLIGVAEQPSAGDRELNRSLTAPSRPVDQRHAGLAFELGQLLRHRGRGQAQSGGRADDAAVAGDRPQHEQPARIQLHVVQLQPE